MDDKEFKKQVFDELQDQWNYYKTACEALYFMTSVKDPYFLRPEMMNSAVYNKSFEVSIAYSPPDHLLLKQRTIDWGIRNGYLELIGNKEYTIDNNKSPKIKCFKAYRFIDNNLRKNMEGFFNL